MVVQASQGGRNIFKRTLFPKNSFQAFSSSFHTFFRFLSNFQQFRFVALRLVTWHVEQLQAYQNAGRQISFILYVDKEWKSFVFFVHFHCSFKIICSFFLIFFYDSFHRHVTLLNMSEVFNTKVIQIVEVEAVPS